MPTLAGISHSGATIRIAGMPTRTIVRSCAPLPVRSSRTQSSISDGSTLP
jgi:hypothetical protein